MNTEKRINRIKALLAKAGSTDSQAEAEALFVKAHEMMLKWRISEEDIKETDDSVVEANEILAFEFSLEGSWERELARVIVWSNCCHYTWRKESKKMTLFGEKRDVQLVKFLYETTRETFRRLSRSEYNKLKKIKIEEWKARFDRDYTEKDLNAMGVLPYRSVYIRSFLNGCCAGLSKSIRRMTQDYFTTVNQQKGYEVLVLNKVEKSRQYANSLSFVKVVGSFKGAVGSAEAFLEGEKTGKAHIMTIPVEHTKKNENRLLK